MGSLSALVHGTVGRPSPSHEERHSRLDHRNPAGVSVGVFREPAGALFGRSTGYVVATKWP